MHLVKLSCVQSGPVRTIIKGVGAWGGLELYGKGLQASVRVSTSLNHCLLHYTH